jgi:hypothetical protein
VPPVTQIWIAVWELLMRHLVALSGKSAEDVAAQMALEIR